MNTFHKIMLAMLVIAVVGPSGPAGGAAAGEREALATHTLTTLDGGRATLSDFKGEVVVVNFWASWCSPCRKELPVLDEWHAAWSSRGARVVAISIDKDLRKAKRFADDTGLSLSLFHDGPDGLAKTLDLPALPCTYLLDRDGTIVTVIRSSSEADLAALHDQVESLLRARPATVQKAGTGTPLDHADSPHADGDTP